MTIAAEVLAALQEAGREVGTGPLVLTFTRQGTAANPWTAPGSGQTYALTVLDRGIKDVYSGGSVVRRARMLMADATGVAPAVGDKVTIGGRTHDVLSVAPQAPAGVALYYALEIST